MDTAHNLGKRRVTEHNRNLNWFVMIDSCFGKDTTCTWVFLWSISCFLWPFSGTAGCSCIIMVCCSGNVLGIIWQVFSYLHVATQIHFFFLFLTLLLHFCYITSLLKGVKLFWVVSEQFWSENDEKEEFADSQNRLDECTEHILWRTEMTHIELPDSSDFISG